MEWLLMLEEQWFDFEENEDEMYSYDIKREVINVKHVVRIQRPKSMLRMIKNSELGVDFQGQNSKNLLVANS